MKFDEPNRVNFDKTGTCMIRSAIEKKMTKNAQRKGMLQLYKMILFMSFRTASTLARQKKKQCLNPFAKPSEIQSNAALADLRQRKGWDEVKKTVERVTTLKISRIRK